MEIEWNNTYSSFNVYFLKIYNIFWLVSSVAQLCWTLYNSMDCSVPGFPVLHCLPELAQTHVLSVGDAIQPSYSLSSSSPDFSFCHIRIFFYESLLHIRWPKYWNFSFSISPSSEYSGQISLRMDYLISLQSKVSQESSPTPEFKIISPLALTLLYGPTLSFHTWLLEKP